MSAEVLALKGAWPCPFIERRGGGKEVVGSEGARTVSYHGSSSHILQMSVEVLWLILELSNTQVTQVSSPCSQAPSLTMAM